MCLVEVHTLGYRVPIRECSSQAQPTPIPRHWQFAKSANVPSGSQPVPWYEVKVPLFSTRERVIGSLLFDT